MIRAIRIVWTRLMAMVSILMVLSLPLLHATASSLACGAGVAALSTSLLLNSCSAASTEHSVGIPIRRCTSASLLYWALLPVLMLVVRRFVMLLSGGGLLRQPQPSAAATLLLFQGRSLIAHFSVLNHLSVGTAFRVVELLMLVIPASALSWRNRALMHPLSLGALFNSQLVVGLVCVIGSMGVATATSLRMVGLRVAVGASVILALGVGMFRLLSLVSAFFVVSFLSKSTTSFPRVSRLLSARLRVLHV